MLSSLWMALRVFLVYLRTSLPDRISSSWINACYSHHIVHALVNAPAVTLFACSNLATTRCSSELSIYRSRDDANVHHRRSRCQSC